MRARKSWFGISVNPAHAVRATKRRHIVAQRLTRELRACLGAGGLARCKPCLDAGALVAAVAGVTQLKCGMVQRARGRAMVKLGRSRETVEGHDGICHDFH